MDGEKGVPSGDVRRFVVRPKFIRTPAAAISIIVRSPADTVAVIRPPADSKAFGTIGKPRS